MILASQLKSRTSGLFPGRFAVSDGYDLSQMPLERGWTWRAYGLIATAVSVGYLTWYLIAFNSDSRAISTAVTRLLPEALVFWLVTAPVVILAFAARERSLCTPVMKALWSGLLAAVGTVAVFWILDLLPRAESWPSVLSLSREIAHAYWWSFTTLAWLAIFSCLHPQLRENGLPISVLPLLVWGFETATNHIAIFENSHAGLRLWWFVAIASVSALLMLLAVITSWRWLVRAEPMTTGLRLTVAITLITAAVDWGFSLSCLSSFSVAYVERLEKETRCKPTVITLEALEIRDGPSRARLKPLLVGCEVELRRLSADQKATISTYLSREAGKDLLAEYERRHSPARWKQLADLAERQFGETVAEKIVLVDFVLTSAPSEAPLDPEP